MSSKSYLVKWEIDVEADSPKEAAMLAWEMQKDRNSEAVYYDVVQQSNQETTQISLLEELFESVNED